MAEGLFDHVAPLPLSHTDYHNICKLIDHNNIRLR